MKQTQIMGILNATPDSFYQKSRATQLDTLLEKAHQMIQEGAEYLDIGGCSTRPGSTPPSVEEEIQRTLPLIQQLAKETSITLSIDTYRYPVAKKAVDAGVSFINDVTGFEDPNMQDLALDSKLPICVMHMQNTPLNMQKAPSYQTGVLNELVAWFEKRLETLCKKGIDKNKIFIDPGIGFGKTVEDNLQILQELERLQELGFPMLLGTSRKSLIQKITQRDTEESLAGTLALNTYLTLKNVEILRVHDVAVHKDMVKIVDALNPVSNNTLE